MREYLYIDDVEINSLLAQQNKGITTNKTTTESNASTSNHSAATGVEVKGGGEGKIPFLAKAEGNLASIMTRQKVGALKVQIKLQLVRY